MPQDHLEVLDLSQIWYIVLLVCGSQHLKLVSYQNVSPYYVDI